MVLSNPVLQASASSCLSFGRVLGTHVGQPRRRGAGAIRQQLYNMINIMSSINSTKYNIAGGGWKGQLPRAPSDGLRGVGPIRWRRFPCSPAFDHNP